DAMCAVLLPVHDHLRCVAATGAWHIFSGAAFGRGVAGHVYATGEPAIITNVDRVDDYIPLGPHSAAEVCVPLTDPNGAVIGSFNCEWKHDVDLDEAWKIVEEIARLLGERISELGGPPPESRSERLLRFALALTSARSDADLLEQSLDAARQVSGLATQVIVLRNGDHLDIHIDGADPTPLGLRIGALDPVEFEAFIMRAERFGASYTYGDPATVDASGFEVLTELGVRTLIAVPVGVKRNRAHIGGVLLSADERVEYPDAEISNLLSLLAAQAWSSLERLRTLSHLRELATSDPLTGLRHQGPFGERLANSRPGRTAMLAIDIDGFKAINDTYGHQAGDAALVDLAQALSSALRTGDELFRVGGDEFAVVVDVQRAEEAMGVAERLVSAARRIGQSISVGVALQESTETPGQTFRRADSALYDAKRGGRDGVRMAA
ncbi:MAG TPA: diguanylate cyclase, partial [Micromonosporaceae bacterium]|nr:diguanylate cyclase [Micromonosporaceae bacterium]